MSRRQVTLMDVLLYELEQWEREHETMAQTSDRDPDFTYEADVMTAISAERLRQGGQWSAAHDYGHNTVEWAGLLAKYAGRFTAATSLADAQHALIQLAALCVAATEAIELWKHGLNPAAALNALDARRKQQQKDNDDGTDE